MSATVTGMEIGYSDGGKIVATTTTGRSFVNCLIRALLGNGVVELAAEIGTNTRTDTRVAVVSVGEDRFAMEPVDARKVADGLERGLSCVVTNKACPMFAQAVPDLILMMRLMADKAEADV